MRIIPEKKIEDLMKFSKKMNVEVYYAKFKFIKENGTSYFNSDIDDFEIFIHSDLSAYEEMKALAHEIGHILRDFSTCLSRQFVIEMGENRAEVWACQYIVRYEDVVNTLKRYDITNDFEAAEELHVDIVTLRKAIRRYELEGKPVRQWQFLDCWGT